MLNALKHGRYSRAFREKLIQGQEQRGGAAFHWIQERIWAAFEPQGTPGAAAGGAWQGRSGAGSGRSGVGERSKPNRNVPWNQRLPKLCSYRRFRFGGTPAQASGSHALSGCGTGLTMPAGAVAWRSGLNPGAIRPGVWFPWPPRRTCWPGCSGGAPCLKAGASVGLESLWTTRRWRLGF